MNSQEALKKWRSPHDAGQADPKKRKALILAIILSCLAFAVQLLGAFYTGSVALLGDTAHLFTDLFSLIMSLMAIQLAARPTNGVRSFGLYRLEVLASFLNGLLLLLVSLVLIGESIERLIAPKPLLALPLFAVAGVGLVLNCLSALALFQAVKGQHHDHQEAHEDHKGHEHFHGDRNVGSALLHVISDALGSVAVIIGALVIHFTGYVQADAWLGIGLSLLIAYWSVRVLVDTAHVLLESTPKHVNPEILLRDISAADGRIRHVEDVHVWEITSRMYAATGEITVDPMSLEEANHLREKVLTLLEDRYGIAHAVFAVKPT